MTVKDQYLFVKRIQTIAYLSSLKYVAQVRACERGGAPPPPTGSTGGGPGGALHRHQDKKQARAKLLGLLRGGTKCSISLHHWNYWWVSNYGG